MAERAVRPPHLPQPERRRGQARGRRAAGAAGKRGPPAAGAIGRCHVGHHRGEAAAGTNGADLTDVDGRRDVIYAWTSAAPRAALRHGVRLPGRPTPFSLRCPSHCAASVALRGRVRLYWSRSSGSRGDLR